LTPGILQDARIIMASLCLQISEETIASMVQHAI
jgi:hypothetical protein